MKQRVSLVESLVDAGTANRIDMARPQIDLINAQLEYANSKDAKRKLMLDLIDQYDKMIDVSEMRMDAPVKPAHRPNTRLAAGSELLLLKADRIRILIELEGVQ